MVLFYIVFKYCSVMGKWVILSFVIGWFFVFVFNGFDLLVVKNVKLFVESWIWELVYLWNV